MKSLAIFDIDGTLTNTVGIDDFCFRLALKKLYSIALSDNEWELIKNNSTGTDSGIFKNIFEKYINLEDYQHELSKFRTIFTFYLNFELQRKLDDIKEISGAKKMIQSLLAEKEITIAIATGSWHHSGLLKLRATDFTMNFKNYSNSDKFEDRRNIVENSINLSKKFSFNGFNKITYFGDGLWDMNAANSLGINFIGIDNQNTNVLKNNGAKIILNDFNNISEIKNILIN